MIAMKQLIDFIPLILFFSVYKMEPRMIEVAGHSFELGGIFSATMVLVVVSLLVYGGIYLARRSLEKRDLITLIAVLIFGGLTLAFHSETFLKWKAPVVNWLFAIILLGSQFIGNQNFIQRMMGHALTLPDAIWKKLNLSWVVFFFFLGTANLWVAFTFESIWVDFKIFGSMGMTFVFMLMQVGYIAWCQKHCEAESSEGGGIVNDQKFSDQ